MNQNSSAMFFFPCEKLALDYSVERVAEKKADRKTKWRADYPLLFIIT